MSDKKVPDLKDMEPRMAFFWAGWLMFKDNCARRNNLGYTFKDLDEESQYEEFQKFKKSYEQEFGINESETKKEAV